MRVRSSKMRWTCLPLARSPSIMSGSTACAICVRRHHTPIRLESKCNGHMLGLYASYLPASYLPATYLPAVVCYPTLDIPQWLSLSRGLSLSLTLPAPDCLPEHLVEVILLQGTHVRQKGLSNGCVRCSHLHWIEEVCREQSDLPPMQKPRIKYDESSDIDPTLIWRLSSTMYTM